MFKVYTLEAAEQWDALVRSFREHDVYYLSGYVRAFALHGDGEPLLLYYEEQDTRAINVVIRRDLAEYFQGRLEKGQLFDLTTPYGYGGFLVEGPDTAGLDAAYTAFCQRENIICEFVRFHPLLENWTGLEKMYQDVPLGSTVYMDTRDPETVWQKLSSKNRNMIRKAQKSGLQVYWGREPGILDSFMEIYNATMDKDAAADYYYFRRDFYESILEDLKHNALWFWAEKEGRIAAAAIFLFCNGKMHYHLSGSRRELSSLAPTNLILYEAALWAAANGYGRLHLGGGVGSGEDGLYKFKKAFNRGEDTRFHIGKKLFMPEKYREMVELRAAADPAFQRDTGFFPAYRG